MDFLQWPAHALIFAYTDVFVHGHGCAVIHKERKSKALHDFQFNFTVIQACFLLILFL